MTYELTDDDKAIIERSPAGLLAKCWCELNCFKWPEGFKDPETVEQRMVKGGARGWSIMAGISRKIGIDACLTMWRAEYI